MASFKPLTTETTVIRSSAAVCMSFVWLQDAALAEACITLRTLVWFFSSVYSHVSVKIARHTECLATLKTFAWLLSTVNSATFNNFTWCCKPHHKQHMQMASLQNDFACVLLSFDCCWNTFHNQCTCIYCCEHSCASSSNAEWQTFLTLTAWMHLTSSMTLLFVNIQVPLSCEPFVTHCTQIRSWLVIMMFSDIITISFSLHLHWTSTCIT